MLCCAVLASGSRGPFILVENVCGMSEEDKDNIMHSLRLDCVAIDGAHFSAATRKRLLFANFACPKAVPPL
eukprot:COSAG01_NODE_2664_length_7291_cov_4.395996_9_plen_71_part_00